MSAFPYRFGHSLRRSYNSGMSELTGEPQNEPSQLSPAGQLTDIERSKIELEELYRSEIRKRIDKSPEGAARWWAFLNSSFALWLLSAIFISGLGALYTAAHNDQERERERLERVAERERESRDRQLGEQQARRQATERLDREISYRLSRALYELGLTQEYNASAKLAGKNPKYSVTARQKRLRTSLSVLTSVATIDKPPLYADYATYSLAALMTELRKNVATVAEQQQLDRVLRELSDLSFEVSKGEVSVDETEEYANRVFQRILLPRWKNSGFVFVGCNAEDFFRCIG